MSSTTEEEKRRKEVRPGDKFNRLTVVSFNKKTAYRVKVWNCRCDCGKEKTVQQSDLTSDLLWVP